MTGVEAEARSRLQAAVTTCRQLLEKSIGGRLEGQYGIDRRGSITDESRMGHLTQDELAFRRELVARLAHIRSVGLGDRDALAQLVRELAFTHLNRLVAFRMLELRGLMRQSVGAGTKSDGFLRWLADRPEQETRYRGGDVSGAYVAFLADLSATLAPGLGVLFDPADPASRLFPDPTALDQVLGLLNDPALAPVFAEDEALGWCYQYFTPVEQRKKAREESAAPRNSYELAFRNQFYTPRYVVEFLVDNTLGRMWYEMRGGETTLTETCRYLIRGPDEVFLGDLDTGPVVPRYLAGEVSEKPDYIALAHAVRRFDWSLTGLEGLIEDMDSGRKGAEDLASFSTHDLWKFFFSEVRSHRNDEEWDGSDRAVEIMGNEIHRRVTAARAKERRGPTLVPFRQQKDPRMIRLIDPASGSGHFLLYAFDLLLTIYREAYDGSSASWYDTGSALRVEYPDRTVFEAALPGLILTHNLHGIDIDRRAAQIASFALWLRAQRAYNELGVSPASRPPITRMHVVVAEPMPGEADLLEEFVADLEPPLLRDLVRKVFKEMQLAGEVGSLLAVESSLRDAIEEARRAWVSRPRDEQQTLFPPQGGRQTKLDVHRITSEAFFAEAEKRVLDALAAYATRASNGARVRRRLFVEDAVQGFEFVELAMQEYDIVLMNPPFGAGVGGAAKTYIERTYLRSKNDLYAAFVDRWSGKLVDGGRLGAITSRTGFFLTSFERWRNQVLLSEARPSAVADLGYGVLDTAMVETAAYILERGASAGDAVFFRLTNEDDKGAALADVVVAYRADACHPLLFMVDPERFRKVPGTPFAYWVSEQIRDLFVTLPPFEEEGRTAVVGLQTSDDSRFLRLWWEVSPERVVTGTADMQPEAFIAKTFSSRAWVPFAKGGEYSPYYSDLHLIVDWEKNGQRMKDWNARLYDNSGWSRNIRSTDCYFRSGLTWPLRTDGLSFRTVPSGCIFSHKGPLLFPPSETPYLIPVICAVLNSRIVLYLVSTMLAREQLAQSYEVGLIKSIPFPIITDDVHYSLSLRFSEIYDLKISLAALDEINHFFAIPALLTVTGSTLTERITCLCDRMVDCTRSITATLDEIDQIAYNLYGIDVDYQAQIEEFLGVRPPSIGCIEIDPRKLAASLLSWFIGVVFGRFDVRYGTSEQVPPPYPDAFTPLPACSIGMLTDDDGLPLTISPEGYPIEIDADGIIVDDPGHPDDIVTRIRQVLDVVFPANPDAIEAELRSLLGVADLRDYLRKTGAGGFFDEHIKRYSKSKRKAPIYWLLQSSRKSYGIWLYYPRMTADTLHLALTRYATPRAERERRHLDELLQRRRSLDDRAEQRRIDVDIERTEVLVIELDQFRDRLQAAADLYLVPDHDDGVVLTIAPLRELVPWRETATYWQALLDGKYPWSSISKQLREKGLVRGGRA